MRWARKGRIGLDAGEVDPGGDAIGRIRGASRNRPFTRWVYIAKGLRNPM